MNIPSSNPNLSVTPEVEQTLLIQSLLHLIAQQQEHTQRQEDEIRRLPEGPKRPHWKPSPLEPTGVRSLQGPVWVTTKGQPRRGPRQQKTAQLKIHATERVPLAEVPSGSLDSSGSGSQNLPCLQLMSIYDKLTNTTEYLKLMRSVSNYTGTLKNIKLIQIKDIEQLSIAFEHGLVNIYQQIFAEAPYFEIFTDNEVRNIFTTYSSNGILLLAISHNKPLGFCATVPFKRHASTWTSIPTCSNQPEYPTVRCGKYSFRYIRKEYECSVFLSKFFWFFLYWRKIQKSYSNAPGWLSADGQACFHVKNSLVTNKMKSL